MNKPTEGMILVSPVFNEQEVVRQFLERAAAIAETTRLQGLVIVDDGSQDKTCDIIADFARTSARPKIRIVRLSRNFGHQNATLAGLTVAEQWAQELNASFVALIDADLQDRPEHLQDLLSAMENSDVAYAVRRSRAEGPFFKFAANIFYNILSRTSNLKVPRYAGTFSVMRTHVVRAILNNSDNLPYLPGLRAWAGFRQLGVPLDRDARFAGDSRVGFRGLFRLAINAVFAYSNLPIVLMALLGTFTLVISFIAAFTIIVLRLAGFVEVQGTALIIVSIFFSLGVQSIFLLMVAYSIRRLAADAGRRSAFVIMEDKILDE
ncbi:glycosyltransferase family 2 protein [Bradyrhizobium sp. CCBAU 53380]|uniref:glycosyltransferase family 2 protein n=1 Tax=Bradyrhizobium sp. CCBAU 53380 TaxID=1325117 RepID=UPI00230327D1|nr:glycosyltransferase family 2 protein [Bradyrhizobium sp. CCBAU 53380]